MFPLIAIATIFALLILMGVLGYVVGLHNGETRAYLRRHKGGRNDLSRWAAFGGKLERPAPPLPLQPYQGPWPRQRVSIPPGFPLAASEARGPCNSDRERDIRAAINS